ncbi:efflux RND transporter periplasmic adaptor subunit [Noviherbaspirillum pedocola]|uniref:Efflux RND transporter periplasmic adaptor subunit n=1 Tax=Noviherbaspirillum pedocola TaxID=2801341 RepID=A0A934SQ36_9BURK|nr:efflux RND transporter periplasmic adaptor subunit [Noviherbaspirillum pedocola]MBK4733430.1 efflux RND transporter periplasmic adaptor subunit [Noviherbaspirillum pedocola]
MTQKTRGGAFAALAVIVGLGVAGVGVSHYLHAAAPEPAARQATPPEPGVIRYPVHAPQLAMIKTATAQSAPLPVSDPLNGRLTYDDNVTARVSSPIAGRVLKIPVEIGDRVARGAVLLQIDAPDLAAADADLKKAQADERRKKLALDRAKTLLEHEVVPQKDAEAAQADYAQATAETRRAALRMKNLNASGSENGSFALRSPIAGVVADRHVSAGAELRPDLPDPLFIVTDPRHLWLVVDVPERAVARIHPGQGVSIETDAWPNVRFPAKVDRIGFALDPNTRRMGVRCIVDNADGKLHPEMFARVFFLADGERSAVPVPNTALVAEGVNTYVFVETEPGVFRKREVRLGQHGPEQSFIEGGVKPGERIVTEGALLLNAEVGSHAR